MDSAERPWPLLPKGCLESIVRRGGPQAAALLSSTCKSWRSDLGDDMIWRVWHGLPLLRYHTYQTSYTTYVQSLRNWVGGRETGAAVIPVAHERWLTSLDLSPSHILSGSLDANVKCWDRSRPGTWLHYLRGHTGPVSSVRLAYDSLGSCTAGSTRAFSGSRDGTLRCWDLATGACVRAYTMEGGRQWVNTVAVWRPYMPSPTDSLTWRGHHDPGDGNGDGKAAASVQNTSTGFRTMGGSMYGAIGTASVHASTSSAALPSPMTVVCGTSIGQLCLYDVRQAVPAQRMLAPPQEPAQGAVYGAAVYGDALAAACASGCIYVWDLRAGSVRHKLDEHGSACTCVAMYGPTLVAGDLEGSVYLWSTQGARMRFRGGFSPATWTFQQSGNTTLAAATSAPAPTTTGSAAVRTPQGPRWPNWRNPRRLRPRVSHVQCGHSRIARTSNRSGSGCSGSSSDGDGGPPQRRCRTGVDGAVAVATLEALSEGRSGVLRSSRHLQPACSPWIRSWGMRRVGAEAAAATGTTTATIMSRSPGASSAILAGAAVTEEAVAEVADGSSQSAPPPELLAIMRHSEWVRDVALVGTALLLSSSKDGLVCLSRTDTMQVVAVWDVAAASETAADSQDERRSIYSSTCHVSTPAGADPRAASSGQVVNQVHALAADEWGFVAGCQDTSMRMWSFSPGGMLSEPLAQFYDGRREVELATLLLSDMRTLAY